MLSKGRVKLTGSWQDRGGPPGADRGRWGPPGADGGRQGQTGADGGRWGPTGARREGHTPPAQLLTLGLCHLHKRHYRPREQGRNSQSAEGLATGSEQKVCKLSPGLCPRRGGRGRDGLALRLWGPESGPVTQGEQGAVRGGVTGLGGKHASLAARGSGVSSVPSGRSCCAAVSPRSPRFTVAAGVSRRSRAQGPLSAADPPGPALCPRSSEAGT